MTGNASCDNTYSSQILSRGLSSHSLHSLSHIFYFDCNSVTITKSTAGKTDYYPISSVKDILIFITYYCK